MTLSTGVIVIIVIYSAIVLYVIWNHKYTIRQFFRNPGMFLKSLSEHQKRENEKANEIVFDDRYGRESLVSQDSNVLHHGLIQSNSPDEIRLSTVSDFGDESKEIGGHRRQRRRPKSRMRRSVRRGRKKK
jgi:hypothetical protein